MEPGTDRAAVELATAIAIPAAGAVCEIVAVQVVFELAVRVAVAQVSDVKDVAAESATFALADEAPRDAVMVAVWADDTVPAVAVNVAVVAFAGTVTEAGAESIAVELDSAMVAPAAGAACEI